MSSNFMTIAVIYTCAYIVLVVISTCGDRCACTWSTETLQPYLHTWFTIAALCGLFAISLLSCF